MPRPGPAISVIGHNEVGRANRVKDSPDRLSAYLVVTGKKAEVVELRFVTSATESRSEPEVPRLVEHPHLRQLAREPIGQPAGVIRAAIVDDYDLVRIEFRFPGRHDVTHRAFQVSHLVEGRKKDADRPVECHGLAPSKALRTTPGHPQRRAEDPRVFSRLRGTPVRSWRSE